MTTTILQFERVIYTTKARTSSDPHGGSSRTSDGCPSAKLSLPGCAGNGTNPARLFAAGWSDCLLSTMKQIAARSMPDLATNVAVDVEVDAGIAEGGFVFQARMNFQLSTTGIPRVDALPS